MMTTNGLHNILNILMAILAGVTAFLLATGCQTLPSGVLICANSWIDPAYTTAITGVLAVLKSVINIMRDGFGGLWKVQPPVEPG
jgi:hypothetical protein